MPKCLDTAVSSVITKGDGHIFFDFLKNNTYGMWKVIEHMFYIQFFKRNPFLKRKKQKKILPGVKNAFFGQNWPKKWCLCTFLHILCTFLHYSCRVQCCPSSGPWETGIWHDFWHSWVQKWPTNVQKRPKTSKMTKNGQKCDFFFFFFFFFFFACFFPIV